MATDNRASTNLNDDERQGRRLNILRSIGDSNFGSGFGTAFNIDPEDRRGLLNTRREAEGKASIPPRAVQTFSQHPLVDSLRQLATTTENPAIRNTLSAVEVRTFDDGMFTYRVNFTAFYEALLSAKVIELCGGGVLSVRGGENKLSQVPRCRTIETSLLVSKTPPCWAWNLVLSSISNRARTQFALTLWALLRKSLRI